MALTYSQEMPLGTPAPGFSLPGTDGKIHSLAEFASNAEVKALVVIFMCNHCPYVVAVQDRIKRLAEDYASRGVKLVGINSNDTVAYPADGFEAMKSRVAEFNWKFPYLLDESQQVARDYGAVCTPDPFVFGRSESGGELVLKYHGRIDDSWKDESNVKTRDLALALDALLEGSAVSEEQFPAMGCSIKWKKTPKTRDQRIHDLKTVYTNFKTITGLLQEGYRLEGSELQAVQGQLQKALGMLKEEIEHLEKTNS